MTMTLDQFIGRHGSQEEASRLVGVRVKTINRWMNGHSKPHSDLVKNRLKELGINGLKAKGDWV